MINDYIIESNKSKTYVDYINKLKMFSKSEPNYIFEDYILSMHIFAHNGMILQLQEYKDVNKNDFIKEIKC